MLLSVATARAAVDDLDAQRARLEAEHLVRLGALADWCDVHGLTDEAAETRRLAQARDPRRLYLVKLASESLPPLPATADAHQQQWYRDFWQLRRAQAEQYFRLAQRSIRVGRASLAYDLALSAGREYPDHPGVRKLLGYQKHRGTWQTMYEVRKQRAGQVWDDRFGWLLRSHLPRYEAGERLVDGRWMPAADEAHIRSDLAQGWQVETEHYLLLTNHSQAAGAQLAARLEQFYRVWQQLFAQYYASTDQLTMLFDGRAPARGDEHRFRVVYFRNRAEYEQALSAYLPPGVRTAGIYVGDRRTAFFFADGEEDDTGTLYHEAAHQLFSESRPVAGDPGTAANFWIVEGIACYFESMVEEPDRFVLGGADTVRFRDARYRLLESEFYVPLAELTRMGRTDFQRDSRLPMLYSQGAGLTHFLMHQGDGAYRDALVRYLLAVYTGRDRPDRLAELTGTTFDELDRQYREFVTSAEP